MCKQCAKSTFPRYLPITYIYFKGHLFTAQFIIVTQPLEIAGSILQHRCIIQWRIYCQESLLFTRRFHHGVQRSIKPKHRNLSFIINVTREFVQYDRSRIHFPLGRIARNVRGGNICFIQQSKVYTRFPLPHVKCNALHCTALQRIQQRRVTTGLRCLLFLLGLSSLMSAITSFDFFDFFDFFEPLIF